MEPILCDYCRTDIATTKRRNPGWADYDLCAKCAATEHDADPNREDVVADNGAHLHIANALYLWEGGEFSEWALSNGFPLLINGESFEGWEGVEAALADFPFGPYDSAELEEVTS